MFASKELQQARLILCATCPKKNKFVTTDICSECGCVLTAKVALAKSECPMQRWNSLPKS